MNNESYLLKIIKNNKSDVRAKVKYSLVHLDKINILSEYLSGRYILGITCWKSEEHDHLEQMSQISQLNVHTPSHFFQAAKNYYQVSLKVGRMTPTTPCVKDFGRKGLGL